MNEYFNHTKKISSVSEFTLLISQKYQAQDEMFASEAAAFDKGGKEVFLYRGVSNEKYPLKASIYREDRDLHKSEYDIYKEVLHAFPEEFLNDSKVVDKLVKMQHYAIPTRLIDVTYNPLVALFFAAGGFNASVNAGNRDDGKVIFFACNPKSIIFSDDMMTPLLIGLENRIKNYDSCFITALNVFRKFLTKLYEQVDMLSESDFKQSTEALIHNIDKELNDAIKTEFIGIWATISHLDSYINGRYKTFWDRSPTKSFKDGEKDFYDALMITYSENVLEYIRKTANELSLDIDASKFKNVSSFLEIFSPLIFIKPKISNKRIERQQGAFFLHPPVFHALNLDDFGPWITSNNFVSSIIIESKAKSRILEELRECGITFSHLFPELDKYHREIYSKYLKVPVEKWADNSE